MNNSKTLITRKDYHLGDGVFDSLAWALSEHCKIPDTGEYKAAVLYGNEDSPQRIDFYTQPYPLVTDKVAWVWTAGD